MTRRPRRDYPIGATYQPDERPLELTAAHLTAVRDAAAAMVGRPGVRRFADFIIYSQPRRRDVIALLARGRINKLLHRQKHRAR
jgi:hypothetical protein